MASDSKEEIQSVNIQLQASNQQSVNVCIQRNPLPSEHLPEYIRIMGYKNTDQWKSHKQQIITTLENSSNFFHTQFDQKLRIAVIQSSRNCEYALLEVRYNRFEFYVWLLNVDEESPSHKIEESHCGNFSTVYHARHSGKDIAIKCTAFRNKTFQKVFRDTLLEYLAFQMAAKLGCGPIMPRIFGFDIVIFKNCIEFSMEFCSHRLRPGPALAADLTAGLRSLHSINVIHFDIKPENICFSEERGRAVFVDFGLHAVVLEEAGQKSATKFYGSLLMCSEQMKKIFMEGSGIADLYYNDARCLIESRNQINSSKKIISTSKHDVKATQQSEIHLLIKLKYWLSKKNSQNSKISQQIDDLFTQLKRLGNNSLHSLFRFIQNLSYSFVLQATIEDFQKLYPEINAQSLITTKFKRQINRQIGEQQSQLSEFQMRVKLIKRLNEYNPIQDYTLQSDKELASLLADEDKNKNLKEVTYYRFFAQIQQVNCWKVSDKVKEVLTLSFNKGWLHIQQFQKLTFVQKQIKCLHHICQFVARQTFLGRQLFLIIKYSLLSVMLLQIYSPQQLNAYLSKIMSLSCLLTTKMRLFIHILSCLQWLQVCISVYNYYYLIDVVFGIMNDFLGTTTQYEPNVQQLVDVIQILLTYRCNSNDSIMHKLFCLQTRLKNQIIKFYTAVRQQEMLLAQLYVYILCFCIRIPENKNDPFYTFFTKLLTLQSYKKQAKLCIFDYYQFRIASSLMTDQTYVPIVKNIYFNKSWGKQYAYNYLYSSQMNDGKVYYQKGNTVYFYPKQFNKLNKAQALLARIGILQIFQRLQNRLLRKNQIIDLSSALQIFSLSEVQNFIPELYRLATYKNYHSYEIFFYFKLSFMYIANFFCYSHLGLPIDQCQRLQTKLKVFVDNIECISCKFKCLEFCFFYVRRKQSQKEIQYFDEQLYRLLLWRMRQKSLDMKVTTEIIAFLCFHSKSSKYCINFLIQYVINNKISATFFYREWIIIKENIILRQLWDKRQPLYFRFIRYLWNYFQDSQFKKQYYFGYFAKFIQLFVQEVTDYEDFFSFNSNYLFENRQVLKTQKYSALYFSMILVSPFRQLQQQVKPFYYIFICKLCSQLNSRCKTIAQRCLYRSSIDNQIKRHMLTTRKAYYLMKLQFKSHQCHSCYNYEDVSLKKMLKKIHHDFRKEAIQKNISKIIDSKIRLKNYQYFDIWPVTIVH